MRRKTYASSAQSTRTSPERNEGEVAECGGRVKGNGLAVFAAEGELPAGSAPIVDNALGVYRIITFKSTPDFDIDSEFQGQNTEEDEGQDGVRGLSIDSPRGSSIDSPMAGSFTSPYDVEGPKFTYIFQSEPLPQVWGLKVDWSKAGSKDPSYSVALAAGHAIIAPEHVKYMIGARAVTVRYADVILMVRFIFLGMASVEAVSTFPLDNAMWQHQKERARECGGQLQIHVMQLADGGCDALWVFSLCSATVERARGVEILAAEALMADGDAQEQADRIHIQGLADLDILEIHP
ncbi:hypothetical protein B0H13DRAFT_1881126 [Mycena leptocephala]|nr:hypothetical protein B0H13DRAFT_1881126 [Mycena leptocephala]